MKNPRLLNLFATKTRPQIITPQGVRSLAERGQLPPALLHQHTLPEWFLFSFQHPSIPLFTFLSIDGASERGPQGH